MPSPDEVHRLHLFSAPPFGHAKAAVGFATAFLASTAQGVLGLGMVFYLQEVYHATGGQVGAFFGLNSLCYVLGCLFLRPLTDAGRPGYILATSTFGSCVLALLMHYGGSLGLAFAFFALSGVCVALFWPVLMGWLTRGLEGHALSRIMSGFNIAWSTGIVISPFLAGWLSDAFGAAAPVQTAAGVFLAATMLSAVGAMLLPASLHVASAPATVSGTVPPEERGTRLRYAGWVGVFATYLALGIIGNIFPLAARTNLGLEKSLIGMLLLFRGLSATLGFALLGQTAFWHFRGKQMAMGQVAMAALMASLIIVRAPWAIGVVLAAVGALGALSYVNSLFHGLAGSRHRAARSAIHESVLSLGMIAGSAIGGVVYQRFNMSAVYLLCSAVLLAGAVVQGLIAVWARRTDPAGGARRAPS